jgi:3-hydroxyisobutyrate dehydrogenase-like beta-hydroxyacid dehydrogenase
MQPKR